jgi:hypothetical protein
MPDRQVEFNVVIALGQHPAIAAILREPSLFIESAMLVLLKCVAV